VLVIWWSLSVIVLGFLLYTGRPLRDDFELEQPQRPATARDFIELGCFVELVVIFLIGAAIWLVSQLFLPLVFGAAYALVVKGIRHVVSDRPQTLGKFAPSLLLALFWSTGYIAPLAMLVVAMRLLAGLR
jgi:hypothetical protein